MSESSLRLYEDLAWLWPMWSDPDDTSDPASYLAWCDHITQLIRKYSKVPAHSILNMACGGGKNAFNLKKHFEVTGIDLSPAMLDHAKRLNPECTFLLADMRDCKLGRQFDSIMIDDGIWHITSLPDLKVVFRTAFEHLRPGGVMVVTPEDTKESFRQNHVKVSHIDGKLKPDNLDVVVIESSYDPDPTDDTAEGVMVYLIREDGKLRVETDVGISGLFALDAWRTALREAGFEVHEETSVASSSGDPTFACVKPV
ncbi:MAG: class I SAM-dependent methyltransferase [Armatimonadetes bacterium]|nr:class I SAM-dependent methyltransferase [Armatimonadota bacterium]